MILVLVDYKITGNHARSPVDRHLGLRLNRNDRKIISKRDTICAPNNRQIIQVERRITMFLISVGQSDANPHFVKVVMATMR